MVIPSQTTYKVALLDLYEGQANEGMRCIREILANWSIANNIQFHLDEFNVRQHLAVPSLDYDLYISSEHEFDVYVLFLIDTKLK